MHICVITFHRAYNVGAVLQSYALSEFLKSRGHTVTFPDNNKVGTENAHFPKVSLTLSPFTKAIKSIAWYLGSEILNIGLEDLRRWRFRNFVNQHLHITSQQDAMKCECSIYGSDQIWNNNLTREHSDLFLGKAAPNTQHKIAYAASIGDKNVDPIFQQEICTAAEDFDAVSIREPFPFDLHDRLGRAPSMVVDPTLLISRNKYDEIAHPEPLVRKKYIFVYLALHCPEALPLARHIANKLHLNIVCVDVTQRGLWRKPKELVLTCSPDRFLAYIRDAEFVITNSFHGTAFSVIYEKKFISIPAAQNDIAPFRVSNLLKALCLENRLVSHFSDDYDKALLELQNPLPKDLQQTIKTISKQSQEWIERALTDIQ